MIKGKAAERATWVPVGEREEDLEEARILEHPFLQGAVAALGEVTARANPMARAKPLKAKGPDVVEELGQTTGTIKSFSPNNGYGFIDCPEMREMGYQDVFLHHAQLGDFKVGDSIIMTVFLNSKGKAQAKDLQRNGGGGGGGGGGGKGQRSQGGSPDVKELLGTLTGVIKSFNEKSGYGFIHCPQVNEMGYNDVFLHHQQKGDFQVGDEVQFTAFLNSKGSAQGMDLQYLQGPAKRMRMY